MQKGSTHNCVQLVEKGQRAGRWVEMGWWCVKGVCAYSQRIGRKARRQGVSGVGDGRVGTNIRKANVVKWWGRQGAAAGGGVV